MRSDQDLWPEARRIKQQVEDDLLALPGVVGVDIAQKITKGRSSGGLAIVISVRAKRLAGQLPAGQLIPKEIAGVPTDVIEEDIALHCTSVAKNPYFLAVHGKERHLVVQGGISVGPARPVPFEHLSVRYGEHGIAGTLGLLVTDRSGSGGVMGVTSFHVACVNDAWMVGDRIMHPSSIDRGLEPDDIVGTLCRVALSRSVDSAAFLLSPKYLYENSIVDVGLLSGTAVACRGAVVRKRGRGSGLTTGIITSTDATLRVDYGDSIGKRTLRNQIRIESAAGTILGSYGDSGSAIVDRHNRVVGLHFAGTTSGTSIFANPILDVFEALDVRLLGSNCF